MKEAILATLNNEVVTIYPEVLAAVGGELHQGMAEGCSLSVNPHAEAPMRIKATLHGAHIVAFFEFLSTRQATDGGTVTYYADI